MDYKYVLSFPSITSSIIIILMADKLPEYIPLDNYMNPSKTSISSKLTEGSYGPPIFPSHGLYWACIRNEQNKYQSTCSTVHSIDPPPGFESTLYLGQDHEDTHPNSRHTHSFYLSSPMITMPHTPNPPASI
jgi:hypothetical protein